MKNASPLIKFCGYVISLLFLYLTFRNTDFLVILDNLQSFNGLALLGALLLNVGFLLVRSLYQQNNLAYVAPNLHFSTSATSIGAALFYNSIFPARLGEVIRVFLLSKQTNARKTALLSYVFIEKLLDLLVILGLLIMLIGLQFVRIDLMYGLIGVVAVAIVIPAGMYLFARFHQAWFARLQSLLPQALYARMLQIAADITVGIRYYRSARQIMTGVLLLGFSWVIMVGIFFLLSFSYLDILDLPWYAGLFLMVFSALSLSVPSAPAGLGVMHYGLFLAVQTLNPASVELHMNVVAAFVLVMHFCIMMVDLCVGGLTLVYSTLFLKQKRLLYEARQAESDELTLR